MEGVSSHPLVLCHHLFGLWYFKWAYQLLILSMVTCCSVVAQMLPPPAMCVLYVWKFSQSQDWQRDHWSLNICINPRGALPRNFPALLETCYLPGRFIVVKTALIGGKFSYIFRDTYSPYRVKQNSYWLDSPESFQGWLNLLSLGGTWIYICEILGDTASCCWMLPCVINGAVVGI